MTMFFKCAVLSIAFAVSLAAQTGAGTNSSIYAQLLTTQSATGRSLIFVNVRNLGITAHQFEFSVAGAPAACTLLIEYSLDAVTWTTQSTNTCTSAGSVAVSGTYMYLTVNLSAFSGGSSPNISVSYRGYLAGQGYPILPAAGGTGTTTPFTAGSVPFAGAAGVYTQDNAHFFWDDTNDRLCLLTNTCSNTLDVNGAKFYVTSAGLMGSYEALARATGPAVVPMTVQGAAAQSSPLQEWKNSAGSVLSSVDANGVFVPTAGSSNTGRSMFSTIPIGGVAYGSLGTDTATVAGTIFWAEVFVPRNFTITGVKLLNGGTVGTNKWIAGLYASAGGAVLANSALAGTTTSGANTFQTLAFTGTYAAVGPARYWIAIQGNGTTDTLRTVAASTYIDVMTKSATGAFGTLTSLTVPVTFTADVGPIAFLY